MAVAQAGPSCVRWSGRVPPRAQPGKAAATLVHLRDEGLGFSQTPRRRVSGPHAAGWSPPPQFLAPWVSPRWQLDYSKCISQEGKREPLDQMKLCFCNLVMKWHPLTGDTVCWFKDNSQAEGLPQAMKTRWWAHRGPPQRLLATAGPCGLWDSTYPPP